MEVCINSDSHLINDGGYWQYFSNLANKYGLVPKTIYGDSYNCLVSVEMNNALVSILNRYAMEIRHKSIEKNWTRKQFNQAKERYMKKIYDLVVRFMGEPPTKFNWRYKDDNENYHVIKGLTPIKFYKVLVPHHSETKMTFIHDPRYPEYYYSPYHLEYGTNMIDGDPSIFINLPLDVFKKAVAESLMNGEPVWFGCDVGACLDVESGTMDTNRFDYKSVLGEDIHFDKADMLNMKVTGPTHAMVFNGVDMDEPVEDEPYNYTKWRVENSWGIGIELEWHPDHGCWQMSDDWFDKYVFAAVIDLKYFEEDTLKNIMANKNNRLIIPPWDVFGTVALRSGCSMCSKFSHKSKI